MNLSATAILMLVGNVQSFGRAAQVSDRVLRWIDFHYSEIFQKGDGNQSSGFKLNFVLVLN